MCDYDRFQDIYVLSVCHLIETPERLVQLKAANRNNVNMKFGILYFMSSFKNCVKLEIDLDLARTFLTVQKFVIILKSATGKNRSIMIHKFGIAIIPLCSQFSCKFLNKSL